MTKKTKWLKRICKAQIKFKAIVKEQKVAIQAYKAAEKAKDAAFEVLVKTNARVDEAKYIFMREVLGQNTKDDVVDPGSRPQ